ncbi:hypothetical protein [Streptomyces sp. 147326]|uniref:hypothetical protein n=1 Tax=Streptomyces sp. 147326 TaxID=3074379 RepID=UPI003857BC35
MTTPHNTTRVKDDYAQQIASDLTTNHTAQQQTRAELHRLQQELEHLEESATVLLKMQEALGITTNPTPPSPAAKPATKRAAVPAARNTKKIPQPKTTAAPAAVAAPAAAPTAVAAPAAAAAGEAKAPRVTRTTGKNEEKKETKKETNGPSWLDLVTAAISGQSEPKSAAEVADTITTAHPERKVQPAVIRNTLEQGVARGLLERTKQGRSVYYTPTPTPDSSQTPAERS